MAEETDLFGEVGERISDTFPATTLRHCRNSLLYIPINSSKLIPSKNK